MSEHEQSVASLAEELRLLTAALAARSDGGADGLLNAIREMVDTAAPPDDPPDVQRIDVT